MRRTKFSRFRTFGKVVISTRRLILHSYDDAAIIAGQGTIGLELIEDIPDVDAIVVPVGGGGLIAGIALAAKTLNKNIKIIVSRKPQIFD